MYARSGLLALATMALGAVVFACSSDAVTATMAVKGASHDVAVDPCHPDLIAPTLSSASASPNTLWPPNHKMWNVAVSYTVSDNCVTPTCALSVSSNEPVNGIGDGNTSPDWKVLSPTMVQLRAERAGPLTGRVYTIGVSCTDGTNTSTTSTTVTVAHDQRAKG